MSFVSFCAMWFLCLHLPYIIFAQREGGKFRLESISKYLPDDSVGSLIPAQDTCGSYG